MKKIGVALLASVLVTGCASSVPRQVGEDYYAIGSASNLRAYVYGEHTIVEFQDAPSLLWVAPPIISFQDDNGVNIGYEREGRFYRFDRRVGTFTMRLNGKTTVFRTSVEPGKNKPYSAVPVPVVQGMGAPASNADIPTIVPEIDVLKNLRTVMENQVEYIERVVDAHQNCPGLTERDIPALTRRIEALESKPGDTFKAIIQVTFPVAGTAFNPSPAVEYVLVPAARIANHINLRGRTDSKVAGPIDARLAQGRALAARQYLIDNGIEPSKINVYSNAEGDFIAPGETRKGRALNRRVEIELLLGKQE